MNKPLSFLQKILIVGMIIGVIVLVAVPLLDSSLRYVPYAAFPLFCIVGINYIIVGIIHVQGANRQGQKAIWHQQPAILLGIVVLFGGALWVISTIANMTLSGASVNRIDIAILIIGIIPLFLFIRAIFYGARRRNGNRGRQ